MTLTVNVLTLAVTLLFKAKVSSHYRVHNNTRLVTVRTQTIPPIWKPPALPFHYIQIILPIYKLKVGESREAAVHNKSVLQIQILSLDKNALHKIGSLRTRESAFPLKHGDDLWNQSRPRIT